MTRLNGSISILLLAAPLLSARGGDSIMQFIVDLDAETDDGKRLQLIQKLAALKSPKAIATLSVELGNEKNPNLLRIEALKGLEGLNHADAQDAIALAALKSDSAIVRARAIDAIGHLRNREFVPACVRGLFGKEPVVRRAAIDALVQFNDLPLAARAMPLVKDVDATVRAHALIAGGLVAVKLSLFVLHHG